MDRLRYLFGVITLVLLVGGGWFLFRLMEESDGSDLFQLEAAFVDARGLKPGADLKYRGIRIGSVRGVQVSEAGDRALVQLGIDAGAEVLIRDNTHFWIVTPRFHGISQGVSGLETLVRDAFVACATAQPMGEALPSGSRVVGDEAPVSVPKDISLPPIGRGDLLMQVLLPENEGLRPGARVMFRGMPVGEVRGIGLADNGGHVEVSLRISGAQRSTVTDKTVFWVAQPRVSLQFSFSNPVSVDELSSLLSPHLSYYTPPKSGVPVPDGYRVRGATKNPGLEASEVPEAALRRAAHPGGKPMGPAGPLSLVRVVYEAEEIDYLSPNDKLRREGTGILYLDAKGRALVLTTRSVCDGAWFFDEGFGRDPKIENEKLGVQLADGRPLRANRIWTADGDVDLAVLHVADLPRKASTTRPEQWRFVAELPQAGLFIRICGERGVAQEAQAFDLSKVDAAALAQQRAGVLLQGGKIVALLGQQGQEAAEKARLIPLSALREDLRPKR